MLDIFFDVEKYIENSMSDFQIRNFIINEQITPYKKLKQAVVEIRARLENKAMMEFDQQEMLINLEKLQFQEKSMHGSHDFEIKLKQLEIKKLKYLIDRKQHQINVVEKETQTLLQCFESIVKTEFDSTIDITEMIKSKDFRESSETDFWVEKLTRSALADLISTGVLSRGVFEAISNVPHELKEKIYLKSIEKQIQLGIELESKKDLLLSSLD